MKLLIKVSVLAILTLLFTGCTTYYAQYSINLNEVERPANATKQYGKSKVSKLEEEGKTKYSFEDEMVRIIWFPSAYGISFDLKNKTKHSVKIIWDEAVYVDEKGQSHKVMHSGVKYTDRNNPQPATSVIRGGSLSDLIFPTDYVYYQSGKYGGWRENKLIETYSSSAEKAQDTIKQKAKKHIGKTIQVMLPIKIQDVTNEYIFVFKIDSFKVNSYK